MPNNALQAIGARQRLSLRADVGKMHHEEMLLKQEFDADRQKETARE